MIVAGFGERSQVPARIGVIDADSALGLAFPGRDGLGGSVHASAIAAIETLRPGMRAGSFAP